MSKAKKKEEIEEVVAEVIPSGDEGGKIAKKKSGRPKKVDGLILAENPHYFISQPNDVTQAISNLSAVERNCWLQILRGIQKTRIFQMDIQRSISLPWLVASCLNVYPGIAQTWIMPSMH